MQLGEVVGAVVGQRLALEPGPQVFHGIEIGRVGRQIRDLDVTGQVVQVVPHQVTAVCLQTIPDDQQRLRQVCLKGVEEFDNLLFLDTALVQPEQAVGAGKTGNDRDVIPVEVKLDDGRLALEAPGTYSGGAFADSRLVDEDDQSAFSLGFFLSAGHARRFQRRTASSSRSIARFSGFCGLNPRLPRMRHTCVWLKCTPCWRSMTAPTRLRVHSSVPNPCSVGFCKTAARTDASCVTSSWAGRPRSGTARSASMPPSPSSAFHVYTVCRATPTTAATAAGPLPASSMRPARNRFFAAALNRFCTMTIFSSSSPGDIMQELVSSCHVLWKAQ